MHFLQAATILFLLATAAFAQRPPEAPEHLQAAQVLLQQHKWKEAAKEFQEALQEKPRDAATHIGLGIALWGAADRQGAFAAFRRV